MDKLRPILAKIVKHHFWMLCALATAIVLFAWYSMYDESPAVFEANQKKVQAAFANIDKVAAKQPAGPTWPDDAQKKGRAIKEALTRVTRKMQAFQASSLQSWPEGLGARFADTASRQGRTGNWPADLLAEYQKAAPLEVDKLHQLVGAADNDDSAGVHWSDESFKEFREQFTWPQAPPAPVMFEAQEKLWIAQAVLGAIAEANKPAPDKFNLPVAAIEVFEIGPLAARDWAMLSIEGFGPQPGARPALPPPAVPAKGANPPVKLAPGAKAAPVAAAALPPPLASAGGSAPASKPIPGLRAYPIRLRLKMDFGAMLGLFVALENQRLTLIIDDVHLENPLTLIEKEPPPAPKPPPVAPGAFGVAAPAAVPVEAPPPAPLGPPLLVQVPRGSIVEIQATCYLAEPSAIEALKIALLGGPVR